MKQKENKTVNLKLKPVGRFKLKSKTLKNDLCNSVVTVFDNGVTHIAKRVMTKDETAMGHKLVATKFGYNVFEQHFAIKYSSLMLMAGEVSKIVAKEKLKKVE